MKNSKIKIRYVANREIWYWDEAEKGYFAGPFDIKETELKNLEDVDEIIEEFRKNHPKNKRIEIEYDKRDLEVGIYYRKCLFSRAAEYVEDGRKKRVEFDVFCEKVLMETEE